jgi:hypothetical protein
MLQTALGVRFFSGVLATLLYKLVFLSERPVGCGAILALIVISAAATTLLLIPSSVVFEDIQAAVHVSVQEATQYALMALRALTASREL